jgi:ATP-binding cassette subfamily F protein uup
MAKQIEEVAFTAENLTISYSDKNILNDAFLTVHTGDKLGIVGRNGCGKSTFFRILSGEEEHYSGNITRRRGLITSYLPQEFDLDIEKTIYDNILAGLPHITNLLNEYESLPADSNIAHQLELKITHLDAWNLDYKIDKFLDALKIPEKNMQVANLSGGEKRRIVLARTLIANPDLLLLDEPTNHLDIESVEWLEKYIQSFRGAVLFITHDRYFLDRTADRIIELFRGKFKTYIGSYSNYVEQKSEEMECEAVANDKRNKFLKKELEWVRKGAKARTTKAQYRVNRYYEMSAEKIPEIESDMELVIPPPPRLGNKVLDMENVAIRFDDRTLFENLNLNFTPGTKIGILGRNGVGKTTLMKVMTKKLKPTEGKIKVSDNVVFNYIDQERVALHDEKTVLEEIGEGQDFIQLGNQKITIWAYLKRFLFEDQRIKTQVAYLSGGERSRLMLAKILKQGGNFLVLDEPTNDLDLATLRVLEDALIGFPGCVVLVSHDRFFLNRICDSILAFEKDTSQLHFEIGNYDYYLQKYKERKILKEQQKTVNQKNKGKLKQKTERQRKLTFKEQREFDSMEENIMEKESRKEEIEKEFMQPDFYQKDAQYCKQLQLEQTALENELDQLYSRWEVLEEIKRNSL